MSSNSDYIDVTSPDDASGPEAYNSHAMDDEGGDMGDDEKHHGIELDMKPEDALPEEDPDADADADVDVDVDADNFADMAADSDPNDAHPETAPSNSAAEVSALEDNKPSSSNQMELKLGSERDSSPSDHPRDESRLDLNQEQSQEQDKFKENPSSGLSRPPQGSEVFVGGITKETTEEDLRNLCSTVGEVFEVRLLKDKETGTNKSFAFVTFTCKEDAERAIQTLTDSEVKGKKVRVTHSQSKHRLFVGNVPKSWSVDELRKTLDAEGEGIVSIDLLNDPKTPGRNRGFAFVEYYNHTCAENARRNMSKFNFRLGVNVPTISWAEPRPEPDASALSSVKVVYVKGLSDSMTEEKLKELFKKYGEIDKVIIPASKEGSIKRDFGFVHYFERSSALKAVEDAEKPQFDGKALEVSLAKPPSEKRLPLPPPLPPPPAPEPYPRTSHAHRSSHSSGGSYAYGELRGSYYPPSNIANVPPIIYGRGPPPAGMTMVPMVLPDGRLGYVFQPPGSSTVSNGGPLRSSREREQRDHRDRSRERDSRDHRDPRGGDNRGSNVSSYGSRGGNTSQSNSRRYRPY